MLFQFDQISDRIKIHTTCIGLQVKSKHVHSQTRSICVYEKDVSNYIPKMGSDRIKIDTIGIGLYRLSQNMCIPCPTLPSRV